MSRIPGIVPVSDLRQHAAEVLKGIQKTREPVVITQRGRAAAVMLSIEEYERAGHEREVLLLLARGEKEIAKGEGADLDCVLAEADALLAEGPQ